MEPSPSLLSFEVKITLRLEEFALILCVPCHGVCVFTSEWAISSLPNSVDSNPDIYPPPHEDPLLIHDALFYPRPPSKTKLKTNVKKWEIILSENAISLTGNKDHPNACLCYMLYCLTIGRQFNLAYYIANRMISVTKSADMTLPYGMLLTRLVEHVRVFSTWMAYGGNTRDLDSFREKKRQDYGPTSNQISLKSSAQRLETVSQA
ncbi:hypothetical protein Tco_0428005 [Tanacetum coccineum]